MTHKGPGEREKRIDGRCDSLVELLRVIKPIYFRSTRYQKAFIETLIGAALWYIPKPQNAWTGKMSLAAIRDFDPTKKTKPKVSEEHVFPRKIAAKKLLLMKNLTKPKFRKLYRGKLGKIHYITPSENRYLIPFQKSGVFDETKNIYRTVGIKLITISVQELQKIKKRDRSTIEGIVNKL